MNSPSHPLPGTYIDNGSLKLVEVLGLGGYGVVYRAVDTCSSNSNSYAVKCLINTSVQVSVRRRLHIREISLHQIASVHPGIVTLHRVIEEHNYTYIIMDYAPDYDLFTQILHKSRYLGNDILIKHVFLQLLDAVEYCHSLGIYHRDLKPENILCFDSGYRVAITDFGLATTDVSSEEFRTGSIYHMSPECQGGSPSKAYSPLHNDVWSLGIILLNLATGRNPWKSATPDDATFQAYVQDPLDFLPTVLPISYELNDIVSRALDVDWKSRITLREFRRAVKNLGSIYSDSVVFEGNLARCPWEAGLDLGTGSPKPFKGRSTRLKSYWSTKSDGETDMVSATESIEHSSWQENYSARAYGIGSEGFEENDDSHSPGSSASSCVSDPATPATPVAVKFMPGRHVRPHMKLSVDPNPIHSRYYTANNSIKTPSSEMFTDLASVGDTRYTSSFFLASPSSPQNANIVVPETIDMIVTPMTDRDEDVMSIWAYPPSEMSRYSRTSSATKASSEMIFAESPESPEASTWTSFQRPDIPSWQNPSGLANKPQKSKISHIFNPSRFFARSPTASWGSSKTSLPHRGMQYEVSAPVSHARGSAWDGILPSRPPPAQVHLPDHRYGRAAQFRSGQHWFQDKFFSSAGVP